MEEVFGGCKVCGKRMLTDWYPLVKRTCHAAKADMSRPRCQQCDKRIKGAVRLDGDGEWARKFCGNRCRQAAFRARR